MGFWSESLAYDMEGERPLDILFPLDPFILLFDRLWPSSPQPARVTVGNIGANQRGAVHRWAPSRMLKGWCQPAFLMDGVKS